MNTGGIIVLGIIAFFFIAMAIDWIRSTLND